MVESGRAEEVGGGQEEREPDEAMELRLSKDWPRRVNESQGKSVGDIANTIVGVYRQLDEEGHEGVDRSLREIDPERANEYHLVAALRALRAQRDALPAWRPLVLSTHKALVARGAKADSILKGLMPPF